jgi:nitroreductase
MKIFEAIRKRRSVRGYLDKPIPEEALVRILEAGRLAPSAKNRQEWRFIIVKDSKVRKMLAKAANDQSFVGQAPVVIVACGIDDGYLMPCGLSSVPIDVAIALDHISLAAVEVGLGTCWIGAFQEDMVKRILDIPEEIRVIQLMPIGYPYRDIIKEKNRLPMESIIKEEHW